MVVYLAFACPRHALMAPRAFSNIGARQTRLLLLPLLAPWCSRKSAISAAWCSDLPKLAASATTLDQLRGAEGAASARYFAAWSEFLPEEFPFERRSAHPPHNAVNACISFGAALVYGEVTAQLHAHGLDPALGCLHVPEDGRWSLALDLMEPYRPCLIEALALHLVSHRILRPEHFVPERGGVYLNPEGRKSYLMHYERRLTQELYSEHRGHRTTLRREFDRAALDFKRALEASEGFAPFVMN
jgi:CRISP-associated protein Cas1